MITTSLWDAAKALSDKIKAAAATASAEELAYLGSAMEKIGGHVSLVDLAQHVENMKAELEIARLASGASLAQASASIVSTTETELAAQLTLHTNEIETNRTIALTDIADAKTVAMSEVTDGISAQLLAVDAAITNLNLAITAAQDAAALVAQSAMSDDEAFFFASFN